MFPTNSPTHPAARASRAALPGSAPQRASYAAPHEAPLTAGGPRAFQEDLAATSYTSRELGLYREKSLDSLRTLQSATAALPSSLLDRPPGTSPQRAPAQDFQPHSSNPLRQ